MSVLRRILAGARRWLDAERCDLCAGNGAPDGLCSACACDLPRVENACPRCGRSQALPGPICVGCQNSRSIPVATVVPYRYAVPADDLVVRLKFHRGTHLAKPMAALIADHAPETLARCECLVPIPLHRLRRVQRGYNQAAEIAAELGRLTGIPVESRALTRRRATRAQSTLRRGARARNVRGAFVAAPRLTRYATVGIVDDVITTGATMSASAAAVRVAGVRDIIAIAFARAD